VSRLSQLGQLSQLTPAQADFHSPFAVFAFRKVAEAADQADP
jgi:hypothetical protein